MEALPKIVYGCPEKNIISRQQTSRGEKVSVNCNICRSFKNIRDRTHRMSKTHQTKLTERFRVLRSKMKMISLDSVIVHDGEWGLAEEFFCYFCDKPVKKHKSDSGFTTESLGYVIHHADSSHMESVKSYLKYHGRKENIEIFCKTKAELENFMAKIPEAKRRYLKKLDILNERDIRQVKESEGKRQQIVEEALQVRANVSTSEAKVACVRNEQRSLQTNKVLQKIQEQVSLLELRKFIIQYLASCSKRQFKRKYNLKKFAEKPKVPPWQVVKKDSASSNVNQPSNGPMIGPTMDTLMKHVANQKKKGLPIKRVGANFKNKKNSSSKWLPAFGGVWNKGRNRQLRSNFNKR